MSASQAANNGGLGAVDRFSSRYKLDGTAIKRCWGRSPPRRAGQVCCSSRARSGPHRTGQSPLSSDSIKSPGLGRAPALAAGMRALVCKVVAPPRKFQAAAPGQQTKQLAKTARVQQPAAARRAATSHCQVEQLVGFAGRAVRHPGRWPAAPKTHPSGPLPGASGNRLFI